MKQYVIIGNSAAGIAAVEAIRKRDKTSKITVISDEDYSAYCRCLISYYLSGEVGEEKIFYRPQNFYKENNIELTLNKKVTRVDVKKSRVVCEDKTQFNYDSLLIATGARPKFPETKGIKKRGAFGLRTIKDAKDIAALLPVTKMACVLGGGLIGLKAAYALRKRKIDVKVVIKSKQVLSQMLDPAAASLVQKRLEENGIDVALGEDVVEVIGNGDIRAVKLDSGKAWGCSLVVVGKGVEPNTDLIKDTEVKVGAGIIAGETMQTSASNIFTAGDVCEAWDTALGGLSLNALWPIAVEQGKIAGANMAGENIRYAGSVGMNSLEFFGLPIISLGVYKIQEGNPGYEELWFLNARANLYKKLILKNGVLIGAILVGDIRNSGIFLRLIREKIVVSSLKERLLHESFGYPEIMDLVRDKERIYV
jgi:nitrite reductase (NADH) large subunit